MLGDAWQGRDVDEHPDLSRRRSGRRVGEFRKVLEKAVDGEVKGQSTILEIK
jgi:hypothetical protein